MRLLSNLHVKGKSAVLLDRAIRSQSHYFIYRPCIYPVCAHKSLCVVYCSLLKSIDLTNREKAFKYLATRLLLVVGQVPPPAVMCCFKELLEIPVFCIHILNIQVTVSHNCRGTLDCLLI